MKSRCITSKIAAFAITVAAAISPAISGVIVGTGASPSKTQLGAATATAFRVSPNNMGHIILVPYFTAQNGNMTVLHLVNNDRSNGKVIRLRFRGAHNGDSLLSMLVTLAAGDIWTGAVSAGPDGRAQLTTGDNSCTLPSMKAGVPQPFLTSRLNSSLSAPQLANHTREGAIEAIVTADIPFVWQYGNTGKEPSTVLTATRPFNGWPACTASVLESTLQTDTDDEATAASRGLAGPTGKVGATWYIMDVPGATTFSGAATHIEAVTQAGTPARGNYALFPATNQIIAAPERYTSDPLLVSAGLAFRSKRKDGTTDVPTTEAVVQALAHDFPDLSTPYFLPASAINARTTTAELSNLLTAGSIYNQYSTESSIAAQTDWLVALPTKRYHTGQDYAQPVKALATIFSVVPSQGDQLFSSDNTTLVARGDGQLLMCSPSNYQIFDREATSITNGAVIVTAPPTPTLCGATPVLTFMRDISALSASVTRTPWPSSFTTGMAWMGLYGAGLPVIGSAFLKLTNPNATPGIAGRYGILYPHMIEKP